MQFTALVVDDNKTNVTLISQLLRKNPDIMPVTFTDSIAALQWSESNHTDLLLVDYMMPGLNGLEFIERFRVLPGKRFVPIVMISAALEREVRIRALELTANDFLNKPLDTVEFTARINNMLTLRKGQLQLDASRSEQIRQHELQYHAVIEASKDGFLVVDMQGRILEANNAYSCLSGYSVEELLSKNICDLDAQMVPDDVSVVLQEIALQGHARFETLHKTWSGRIWPVEVSVSFIAGPDGGRCYSFLHDISRRKQDEAQLRKLSQAVEQSPNSNIICDTKGVIEYVNAAFSAITGYSAQESLGRKAGFIKSGETSPETYAELWQALEKGQVWQGEFINRRKNGELYNDLSIISPLRQTDGQITHYISIQKDITQKKQIEMELDLHRRNLEALVQTRTRELIEAKMQADTANQAKSDFLANISHEIRTPMNAIIGFNALCLRTCVNEKQKDYLTKIGSAALSLLQLINDVLDHSKIEAGQMTLESIPVSIEQLVATTTSLLETQADEKGLKINIQIAEEISYLSLLGDPLRLKQVLLNLCSNAIKFTARGQIHLRCQVEMCSTTSVSLLFSVQDSGIGISPEQIDMLFQPFTQADTSTTRRFGGTGLGLSICRGLVENMGGRIWVESKINSGSTFFFTAKLGIGTGKTAVAVPALELEMARLRGVRILLVDDNAFNQQVIGEMLAESGLVVDTANNGLEAIRQLDTQRYDALLMDIQMPVMDGYTACQLIRQNPACKVLPIIALTANVSQSEKARCEQVGMNDHLAKPIDPELLFASLLRWIKPVESALKDSAEVVAALEIPDFPGVNAAAVIKRMRGNVQAYRRLHGLFCQQFQDSASSLQQALEAGDFEAARRLAHTAKGAAGTIGADELSAVSARLEELFKLVNPDFNQLVGEFEAALKLVLSGRA
jgi:two-component system sensor histidine kinase/response regulator